nr:MAG TPA: hypothetical protein [Caudoviricetes sp.]
MRQRVLLLLEELHKQQEHQLEWPQEALKHWQQL